MQAVSDRVYVSWTEAWEIDRYIDHYLRSRRIAITDAYRERVWRCLALFPGGGPYRKSDFDLFLDANFCREPETA